MIWDADFMLGPPNPDGTDSYVLGEINVSSVFPIPDEAPAEIAHRVADGCGQTIEWVQCPLWVISGHAAQMVMSALRAATRNALWTS